MSKFSLVVILGVLMILGGLSLMATPLITFVSAGYFIIFLFFVWGIYGIFRGISEKRYDGNFFFSILSLIMGIIGLAVPDAAALANNLVLLQLAAGWFIVHGVLSVIDAVTDKENSTGLKILGMIFGVLEVIIGIYSFAHPGNFAVYLGFLIGIYFVETGVSKIATGAVTCKGGNNMTILFTVMGILSIIAGFSMLATPLLTFISLGHCIIMLFFINGVLGVVRGFIEKNYGRAFWFSILSLILGIIGLTVPGMAAVNNSILLYLAAGWFILHAVLTVIAAIQSKEETGTGFMIFGIILGVLEFIMGIYSIAHPAVLALSVGLLAGFYFVESGVHQIFLGSAYAKAVAAVRKMV